MRLLPPRGRPEPRRSAGDGAGAQDLAAARRLPRPAQGRRRGAGRRDRRLLADGRAARRSPGRGRDQSGLRAAARARACARPTASSCSALSRAPWLPLPTCRTARSSPQLEQRGATARRRVRRRPRRLAALRRRAAAGAAAWRPRMLAALGAQHRGLVRTLRGLGAGPAGLWRLRRAARAHARLAGRCDDGHPRRPDRRATRRSRWWGSRSAAWLLPTWPRGRPAVSAAGAAGPGRTWGRASPARRTAALARGARDADDAAALADVMRHNLRVHMLHDAADVDALALHIHTEACLRTRFRSKAISRAGGLADVARPVPRPVAARLGRARRDRRTRRRRRCAYARAARNAGRRVVPGAGHWVQYERADDINRLLLDWLGETARGPDMTNQSASGTRRRRGRHRDRQPADQRRLGRGAPRACWPPSST